MKKLIIVILLVFSNLFLHAQNVVDQILVEGPLAYEEVYPLDISESKVLFTGGELLGSIGDQEFSFEDSIVDILFCSNHQFEIEWHVVMSSGFQMRFLDAKFTSSGSVLACGVVDSESGGSLNNDPVEGQMFLAHFTENGELDWIQDGYGKVSVEYMNLEVDSFGEIYLVCQLVNFEALTFAGYTFESQGTDIDFPTNTLTLKFDNQGEELWGRILQGNNSQTQRDIKIDLEDNILIIGESESTDLIFADNQLEPGPYIIKYSSQGEELWGYSVDDSDENHLLLRNYSLAIDNENNVYSLLRLKQDSIHIENEWSFAQCFDDQDYSNFILKLDNEGFYQQLKPLECGNIQLGEPGIFFSNGSLCYGSIADGQSQVGDLLLDSDSRNVLFLNFDENLEVINHFQSFSGEFDTHAFNFKAIDDLVFCSSIQTDLFTFGNLELMDLDELHTVLFIWEHEDTDMNENFKSNLNIYPNPTSGQVMLSVSSQSLGSTVVITDLQNKHVKSLKINQVQQSIDLTDLAPGVYFFQYVDSTQKISLKMIRI